ncbi:MAG: HEPN domain-containing protein [Candidatus Polarisedimenticolia bacterium]
MPRGVADVTATMTNVRLAEAFLDKARERLKALDTLRSEADFTDVIREARDIVELCFRGMLRIMGVEVSRYRDAGEVLAENIIKLPPEVRGQAGRLHEIYVDLSRSKSLVPPEEGVPVEKLMLVDADRATAEAEWVLEIAQLTLDIVTHRRASASR